MPNIFNKHILSHKVRTTSVTSPVMGGKEDALFLAVAKHLCKHSLELPACHLVVTHSSPVVTSTPYTLYKTLTGTPIERIGSYVFKPTKQLRPVDLVKATVVAISEIELLAPDTLDYLQNKKLWVSTNRLFYSRTTPYGT